MSDPVKNIEIEDVLSSIRRLVSEENRPDQRGGKPAASAEPAGRLVLTPSLRVAETQDTDDVDAPAQDAEAEDVTGDIAEDQAPGMAEDSAAIDPEAPWKDPQATLYKAAQVIAEETADQNAEDVADDAQSERHEDEANMPVDLEDGSEPDADWYDPDDAAASDTDTGDRDSDPAADDAWTETDEPAVDHGEDHLDEMNVDADDETEEAVPIAAVLPGQPDPAEDSDEDRDEEAVTKPDADDAIVEAVSLSAKIEVLEAAVADTADRWEPDGAGQDEYSGTRVETMQWHDVDGDEDQGDAPQDTADPGGELDMDEAQDDDDVLDFLVADEAVLDEESLRELVADIVREELQGALGERITRNVRKLVRREIHRALAAQELE